MHLLYYHQHFSTRAGSAGTRSYELATRLVARGHRVTMVCGSYGQGQTGLVGPFEHGRRKGLVDGIEVIELELPYSNQDGFWKRAITFLKFALRSTAIALRSDYDLIFATTTPLTAGIPGIAARWLRGKPFVFEVRDLWPELPKAMGVIRNPIVLSLMSFLEWASYRSAHRCIGLSPGIVEGICKRGVARDRVALVPNGCDLDLFAGNQIDAWAPPGVASNDLVAIFTGTHGLANGLDAVLDAASALKRRGRNDVKLVFVGNGALKASLEERAAREALDNCIFHPPVPKTQLAGLMRRADVGLMILANVPAFYFGTSPNKFFDYIAAGKPVLNNYPGWVAEMVASHRCGLAVPPEDAEKFADALEYFADHRDQLPEMGARGQALAKQEFDRDVLADKWSEVLEGAASA